MIKVTLGNNSMTPKSVLADENKTLKSVMDENDFNYSMGTMYLNGSPLMDSDLDKTFASLGVTTSAYLLAAVNTKNA